MVAKVALGLLTDKQDFQLVEAAAAREAAEQAGLAIEIAFAGNNAVVQIQQLFRWIHAPESERPLAIVVKSVTGEGLVRVARNAVEAGIGWILLGSGVAYIEALRRQRPDLPIGTVAVDHEEIGRIQGRQLGKVVPRGGSVLYVQGPSDTSAARLRLHAVQQAAEQGGFELKVLEGHWTEQSAERAVSAWLRLSTSESLNPAAIAAQNDAMVLGARSALRKIRPEWARLPLFGCDGLPAGGQALVARGELAGTIIAPPAAGVAVTLVARMRAGERPALDQTLTPRAHPSETS
jgi:ribose transport system substrate-binding protein